MEQPEQQTKGIARYWPLYCLILIAALMGFALTREDFLYRTWMHYFMGVFLCQFASFKLFHPLQFAEGFQMYDLIAGKSRLYALLYPLIELILGLGFLSFILPYAVYVMTIVILGIGAVGVLIALARGLDVRCVCMGTVLNVPLSTVTLIEDIGMVLMSMLLIVY